VIIIGNRRLRNNVMNRLRSREVKRRLLFFNPRAVSRSKINKNDEQEATTENRTRKKQQTIWIVTYNIRNGRQGGLESAVRALKWINVYIAVL
jgi:hypothetical protein